MESESFERAQTVKRTLLQMSEGVSLVEEWNKNVHSVEDYVTSPEKMKYDKKGAARMGRSF